MTIQQRNWLAVPLLAFALIASGSVRSVRTTSQQAGADDGYDVSVQVSEAGGGTTWTYTITRTAEDAKELGHFVLNFDTCGGQSPAIASILSATVNGVNWLDRIQATEGVTGCGLPSANFVKFDELPEAD